MKININFINEKLSHYIQLITRSMESIPLNNLLHKIKSEDAHLSVLMDKYGGTSGIVTFEDVIKELIGENQEKMDVGEYKSNVSIN